MRETSMRVIWYLGNRAQGEIIKSSVRTSYYDKICYTEKAFSELCSEKQDAKKKGLISKRHYHI